jgi:aspartate kinase
MEVFKFGGASLQSEARIRAVAHILEDYRDRPLLVVVSAMDKTTNDLEKMASHYYQRQRETAAQLWHSILERHRQLAESLLGNPGDPVFGQLQHLGQEMEWQLGEKPYLSPAYYYDQVVSRGELLSSWILTAFLRHEGLAVHWMDAREVIRTDHNYRDGHIEWEVTQRLVQEKLRPLLDQPGLVITQGFIGGTEDGKTTTLGREGSDYSAAVFANMLDAKSLHVWKDVEGIKNADPKLFPDTISLAEMDYHEVIEMAYYGAQVIHPKTIKPLQNKKIPLFVRCFLNKTLPGTIIHESLQPLVFPPIIVLKKQQVLITVTSRDFSFITEAYLSRLYTVFNDLKIKLNLIQNGAISFSCCIDQDSVKIENLMKMLHGEFQISYHEGLELLTVRHYKDGIVERLTGSKNVLLEQRSAETVQRVLKG